MSRKHHFAPVFSLVFVLVALLAAIAFLRHESQALAANITAPAQAASVLATVSAGLADGDSDEDGDVDTDDWVYFTNCIDGPNVSYETGCQYHDFDLDSDVDLADAAAFQRAYTGPPCACDPDVDGDGRFSALDVAWVATGSCWMHPAEACQYPGADIDCSGFIDQTDWDIITNCTQLPIDPPIWACPCP